MYWRSLLQAIGQIPLNYILQAVDAGWFYISRLVGYDSSAAFDTVDHTILLHPLYVIYGFRGCVLSLWCGSPYVGGRCQLVRLDCLFTLQYQNALIHDVGTQVTKTRETIESRYLIDPLKEIRTNFLRDSTDTNSISNHAKFNEAISNEANTPSSIFVSSSSPTSPLIRLSSSSDRPSARVDDLKTTTRCLPWFNLDGSVDQTLYCWRLRFWFR